MESVSGSRCYRPERTATDCKDLYVFALHCTALWLQMESKAAEHQIGWKTRSEAEEARTTQWSERLGEAKIRVTGLGTTVRYCER
mmetsp:Transcript_75422/g.125656  ORF Transcript_75422/g.125656 Transcript_75422/m.125656 type:complete len:85 (-) Transcript_75422:89-343(-)